jgi:tetratricopeptide (TPR) repeat protein
MTLGALAEAYLYARRLEAAEATAHEALRFARRHGERGYEASVRWALGELARVRDDATAAARYFEDAASIGDELGMRPLLAHCHLGLGRLHRHTGKRHEAQEHLGMAAAMYREMDMRFWLEQAAAAQMALS